jgi:geranylgeranylglycerol-phosphate geranylgeranyltransferase
MLAAALIGTTALLVVIVVWVVGVAYNWRFKRTGFIGNLLVAFSVGSTFVFGGIVVGHPTDVVVLWFGVIAFLLDLGEEIAADAMDMEGDALIGSRSLAIVLGQRKALVISASIFYVLVIVSIVPFVFGWLRTVYAIPMILMDAVIMYSTVRLLSSRSEKRRLYIRWIYLGATAAILAFIILWLVVR